MITFKQFIHFCLLTSLAFFWLFLLPQGAFAQRRYTIEKPPERPVSESVIIRTKPAQATKGVLAVILEPVVPGQTVVIKDSAGKVINKQEEIKDGQAEFQLQRGKIYQVEASKTGYLSAFGKSKALKASEILRLRLVPQFVKFDFGGLPSGAQIFIDGKLRATIDKSGVVSIDDVEPGKHSLRITHPEHNDYNDNFEGERFEAGDVVNYSRIRLTRVAKLTVQGPVGASVFIDGAMQGKIRVDGMVNINYELDRATERTISVELLGFQTWSRKETLAPGPRTITIKLDPVTTSASVTDFFDTLTQWTAPSSWEIVGDARNKKLRVKGTELGVLKDKIYRDVQQANFTVWLDDAKGATWAVRADKEGRNYYLFHLAGPNSATHTPKRFYTYLVKDGEAPKPEGTPVPILTELNQEASYTITLEITGHKIQHWITSNVTGQKDDLGFWEDPRSTKDIFLYGTFGFRSLAGEVFTVDDFTLQPANQ